MLLPEPDPRSPPTGGQRPRRGPQHQRSHLPRGRTPARAYFALQSGTLDSIIYDVLAEETGHSDGFQKELGRLRLWEGVALISSALAGGGLAALTSPRFTYFLTIPFVVLSIGALSRFTEPRLHRAGDALPLRSQIATTYRTIVERSRLRPIVITMVLSALLLQMLLEFGPLWMVALAAPAILYGPQWAGLMSAVGFGGVLAGRITLTRPATLATVVAVMLACSLTLTASHNPVVIIAAQVALALLLVAVSTLLTRLLHDEIPSSLRAGVSSGVGTLTWMAFLPFALAFGFLSKHSGVPAAAWMVVAATTATCASLLRLALSRRPPSRASRARPWQATLCRAWRKRSADRDDWQRQGRSAGDGEDGGAHINPPVFGVSSGGSAADPVARAAGHRAPLSLIAPGVNLAGAADRPVCMALASSRTPACRGGGHADQTGIVSRESPGSGSAPASRICRSVARSGCSPGPSVDLCSHLLPTPPGRRVRPRRAVRCRWARRDSGRVPVSMICRSSARS